MKIAAVISEYNPFHHGHKYQLDLLKEQYDGVMVVMSGNFVQRGELAVRDKWTRARCALLGGADLVTELPAEFAVNTAEKFARGAVLTVDASGVVDCLSFGSESGNIDDITDAAKMLNEEPPEASKKLGEELKSGMSYPSARAAAYDGIIKEGLLDKPNNILATEYVRALTDISSRVKPTTIKRIGSDYNDVQIGGRFSSAAAIRELMKSGKDYSEFMPKDIWEIINQSRGFDTERIVPLLKYTVLTRGTEYIERINDVGEGLENKIAAAVRDNNSFYEIAQSIKSKRYTMSRIKRILISILLGTEKQFHAPEYIRILGMNDTGKQIIKEMKTKSSLPVVTKTADFSSPMLKRDVLACDISYLCCNSPIVGMDYKTSPIVVKNVQKIKENYTMRCN